MLCSESALLDFHVNPGHPIWKSGVLFCADILPSRTYARDGLSPRGQEAQPTIERGENRTSNCLSGMHLSRTDVHIDDLKLLGCDSQVLTPRRGIHSVEAESLLVKDGPRLDAASIAHHLLGETRIETRPPALDLNKCKECIAFLRARSSGLRFSERALKRGSCVADSAEHHHPREDSDDR